MTHESPHDKAADAVHEGRPVEAQYVRGGRGGVRILTLLAISLAAVAVLLLGMWFVSNGGFASTNDGAIGQAEDVTTFNESGPNIPSPETPTTATGQPAPADPGQVTNAVRADPPVEPAQ